MKKAINFGLVALMVFVIGACGGEKSVKIGNQVWMSKNLNDPSKGGKCYEDKPENCEKYGRLYTWDEAMKACPNGWRVPNNEEWEALVSSAGGTDTSGGVIKASNVGFPAGGKLKAKSGWNNNGNGTDDFGFSALPGGRGSTNFGIYSSIGEHGYWWSSNDMGEEGPYGAFSRNMFYANEGVFWGNDSKDDLLSVRCVK